MVGNVYAADRSYKSAVGQEVRVIENDSDCEPNIVRVVEVAGRRATCLSYKWYIHKADLLLISPITNHEVLHVLEDET